METVKSKIDQIARNTFPYTRDEDLHQCFKHRLATRLLCFDSKCSNSYQLICQECSVELHPHQESILDVREIVPKLQKYIAATWDNICRQDRAIKSGYRRLADNLQYCIDIFSNLKKDLLQDNFIKGTQKWIAIIDWIQKWMTDKPEPSRLAYEFRQFINACGMKMTDKATNIQFEQATIKRQQMIKRQQLRIKKIDKFVDKALLFSADLDALQEVRKRIIHKRQIEEFNVAKICSLDDKHIKEEAEKIDQLTIALKEDTKDQSARLKLLIQNYSQLKSMDLKLDKVKLRQKSWVELLNYLPNLTKLRQLKLTVRGEDLQQIAKIFQTWLTKLRPIDRFHLKVSDCKNLNILWVYTICNCFQLSGLWISLTRCSVTDSMCKELLMKLKTTTRMSNLPLTDLHLNLAHNKLEKHQKVENEQIFETRYKQISKKTLQT